MFKPSQRDLQGIVLGKMIGRAKEGGCFYTLEECPNLIHNNNKHEALCNFSLELDSVMRWHQRLGHPSFPYLKQLMPTLFQNKSHLSFKCDIYELAKHYRSVFHSKTYMASKIIRIFILLRISIR